MKRFLLTIGLFTLYNVCMAHTITPQCWNNGRFGFNIKDVQPGMVMNVHVNNWDTTINITSKAFTMTVPTNGSKTLVKFSFTDGYKANIYTTLDVCRVLPLKYKDFKAKYIGNDELLVTFELYEVVNVRQVNINVSLDKGKTYITRAVVLPDTTYANTPYSVKFKYK